MRLSTYRVRVSDPLCQEIAENSPAGGSDPSIPSFCIDAEAEGKNGLQVSNPNDIAYLRGYISSLLKEFFKQKSEIRLLRLQLEDSRCAKVTQMESERWS